jgi:hypothetical protein
MNTNDVIDVFGYWPLDGYTAEFNCIKICKLVWALKKAAHFPRFG